MKQTIIAKEGLLNDAQWLIDTIQGLVETAQMISEDKYLTAAQIRIDINPSSDRSDMRDTDDNAFLIEETLSDGSKVYNIEIFA